MQRARTLSRVSRRSRGVKDVVCRHQFADLADPSPQRCRRAIVVDEAWAVADELGLPRWWLNEQASAYVAPGGDAAAPRVFDHPGLRVSAASPEHLLAMKAFAARPRDAEDIRQLASVLDLHNADEVLASVHEIFPDQEPPQRLRLLLEDIFANKDDQDAEP